VPEQDGRRQQRAEQVSAQVERYRAGPAASDDVDLDGRDDQRDDAASNSLTPNGPSVTAQDGRGRPQGGRRRCGRSALVTLLTASRYSIPARSGTRAQSEMEGI
jgi:hypothetical protein